MVDCQVQGVLALVRAALTGKAQPLPADFDLEGAYEAIIKHNIAVMALEGAVLCGIDKKLPAMQKLFLQAFQAIGRVEAQDRAARELFAAFEAEGIDFMPVKGALLRGLYPKREYRSMGDMDVLIRVEQYDRIRGVMKRLGFTGGEETDHELIWQKEAFLVELHKHLIPSYNEDYYKYYDSGWKLARATETSRFVMSDEDHYLFVFAHFAKHYRDGGVGIRQMCDLWLMRRAQADMDADYLRRELDKLQLWEFHENIMQTLRFWFEDGCAGEKEEFITNVVYQSGAFGRIEEHMLAQGARMAGAKDAFASVRYKNLMQRLFLPPKDMKHKYPVLKRMPVLMPIMWVYRICYISLFETKKVIRVQKSFQAQKRDSVGEYQHLLDYVGLRFRKKNEK